MKSYYMLMFVLGLCLGILITTVVYKIDIQCGVNESLLNESFLNGSVAGMNYVLTEITKEAIRCNQIPVNYSNYTYTLITAECLQLNTQEAQK